MAVSSQAGRKSGGPTLAVDYARRHVRFGWWSLLFFASFGLGLELLHGFKVSMYLDVQNESRRLMWTLSHAHGSLLALVHLIFGVSLRAVPDLSPRNPRLISGCLIAASLALPGGFFLGGIVVYGGDPGLGVLVVPAAAAGLLGGILLIARRAGRRDD